MSIFSSIGSFLGGAARVAIGAVAGNIPVVGPAISQAVVGTIQKRAVPPQLPAIPGVGTPFQALPVRGQTRFPNVPFGPQPGDPFSGRRGEVLGAGGACPTGFHLDKRTRTRCVRNRRMNPLNGKAATRAIRRIKGARKMLQKIERQLPRAKARSSRPTRHLTGPTHT